MRRVVFKGPRFHMIMPSFLFSAWCFFGPKLLSLPIPCQYLEAWLVWYAAILSICCQYADQYRYEAAKNIGNYLFCLSSSSNIQLNQVHLETGHLSLDKDKYELKFKRNSIFLSFCLATCLIKYKLQFKRIAILTIENKYQQQPFSSLWIYSNPCKDKLQFKQIQDLFYFLWRCLWKSMRRLSEDLYVQSFKK